MTLVTIVRQFGGHRGHGFDGCLYDVVVLLFRACGEKSVILLVVAHLILLDLESFIEPIKNNNFITYVKGNICGK